MKSIHQIMEENNFIILDTVEEAEILAKDMRERKRHCTAIIELDDGKFTVWPEGYALTAGIEPVKVFHMSALKGAGKGYLEPEPMSDERHERVANLLQKLLRGSILPNSGREINAQELEAQELMKMVLGCLLMRSGKDEIEFKADEIDRMTSANYGFELHGSPDGIRIVTRGMH